MTNKTISDRLFELLNPLSAFSVVSFEQGKALKVGDAAVVEFETPKKTMSVTNKDNTVIISTFQYNDKSCLILENRAGNWFLYDKGDNEGNEWLY